MIATADFAWPRVGQRRITLDLSPNAGLREPPGRNRKRPANNYTVPNNQQGKADDPARQLVAKLDTDRPSRKDKGKAVMRDDGPSPVEDSQPMSPRTREELERRIERLETFVCTHWAEAVPSSPATSEMDMSDSSGERHNHEAASPRKGILTDPYIPPTSKSAIKDGVWYTQQGGKAVTISRSKKRKLQKRYGSILCALRAVEEGAVLPSQLPQTPERMWREAEGLRAFLQMPPVTPPRICEQFSDEPTPKANVFCRLVVPPKQHPPPSKRRPSPEPERRRDPQPSRRRPSAEPERRRDPQPARPKPSPEPEKRRDQQPSRHRPPPEPERRKTPPTGPRRKLFTTPDPESKREPSQPSRQRERQNPEANIRRDSPPPQ
uniref:serine/arginine repetitive matrix protein 1-like n=1 Tax=Fragaria vesca subsp. vesca TaxID=101020 RepID=UPI0005CA99DF|nr:PREDICTED: serine/arginine repetitive matrix protein 1-like [Fragaria vesca subsp. vesca]